MSLSYMRKTLTTVKDLLQKRSVHSFVLTQIIFTIMSGVPWEDICDQIFSAGDADGLFLQNG